MGKLKLTYFDFDGGRGEPARLAMVVGGIDFEDHRVSFQEFRAMKNDLPFGGVPVLEVEGQNVTQSNGINRYVGKLAGLYPEDPWQAVLCDEAMDVVEEATGKLVATFSIDDEAEKKKAREALADGPLTFFLQRMEARLKQRGGEYFADNRLTVADLKVLCWIRHLRGGKLDHIPTDLADRVAPLLVDHHDAVLRQPKIADYYSTRS